MKRRQLYIVYGGLWLLLGFLLLSSLPKELAHQWAGQGSLVLPLLIIYGAPVLVLYLISAFLFDVREEILTRKLLLTFLRRRRILITAFVFAIISLLLLILTTVHP